MKRLIARSKSSGTIRGYTSTISLWMDFAEEHNLETNPANPFGVAKYITHLADAGITYSLLSKISPALTLLHESQNHNLLPAVQTPFVKLLLSGAKREAAERKEPVKKAQVLSQEQIHQIVDLLWKKGVGVIDSEVSLTTWRAVVRIYMMYKTLCRNDCYNHILSSDVIFAEDHVQINFCKAKNDQFYEGSISILANLPNQLAYCPNVILSSYFKVMSFTQQGLEYLNCRLRFSKKAGLQSLPNFSLAYTSSLTESRELCSSLGFVGNFSEKSYKVAGVSQGFDAGLSSEEMMYHGRWKSIDTPKIYYAQNNKKKMEISSKIV